MSFPRRQRLGAMTVNREARDENDHLGHWNVQESAQGARHDGLQGHNISSEAIGYIATSTIVVAD